MTSRDIDHNEGSTPKPNAHCPPQVHLRAAVHHVVVRAILTLLLLNCFETDICV